MERSIYAPIINVNQKNLSVALDQLFNKYSDLEEIIFKFGQYAVNMIEFKNRTYFINNHNSTMLQKVAITDTCFKIFPADYLIKVWNIYKDQLLARARRGPKMMLILYILYESFFTEEMSEILIDRMRG